MATFQFIATDTAFQSHTALSGQDHAALIQIHQNPQTDSPETFISGFVIGNDTSGKGGTGGRHRPGLYPDRFTMTGKTGNLYSMADNGPEHSSGKKYIPANLHQFTMLCCHSLGIEQEHGRLQISVPALTEPLDS